MNHVIVWTVGDIFGMLVIGVGIIVVGFVFLLDKIDRWKREKALKKSRGE